MNVENQQPDPNLKLNQLPSYDLKGLYRSNCHRLTKTKFGKGFEKEKASNYRSEPSGTVSIITQKLMQKLGLTPTQESKTVVVITNGGRAKALSIVENMRIFTKSRATLDFGKHTLHIRSLGKQATINTIHIIHLLLLPIDENDDDEQWIDKLDKEEELEMFFSDELAVNSDEDLYYNPWEQEVSINQDNPAIYLTEISNNNPMAPRKPEFNVEQEVTSEQKKAAQDLLVQNYEIFATDISKNSQTI
ncbi:9080_t:CDS:2, partial [Ambispora leptoticha]